MGRGYREPEILFGPTGRRGVALFPIGFRHSNSVASPSPRKLSTYAPMHFQHRGSSR